METWSPAEALPSGPSTVTRMEDVVSCARAITGTMRMSIAANVDKQNRNLLFIDIRP
jgi:hypothetical protein